MLQSRCDGAHCLSERVPSTAHDLPELPHARGGSWALTFWPLHTLAQFEVCFRMLRCHTLPHDMWLTPWPSACFKQAECELPTRWAEAVASFVLGLMYVRGVDAQGCIPQRLPTCLDLSMEWPSLFPHLPGLNGMHGGA